MDRCRTKKIPQFGRRLSVVMQSKYTKKTACPQCGSKDNLAWFDDGHAYCFSVDCDYTFYPKKKNLHH